MDLSNAFDCIPHNLFIVKLHAYMLSFDMVNFLSTYIENIKENVKINNTCSMFEIRTTKINISPNFINTFLNELFLWLNKSDFDNFACDNTICVTSKELEKLLRTLEDEPNSPVNWFRNNMMINTDKLQAIILKKRVTCHTLSL